MAVTKARTFDMLFQVNERRSEGNENPKNAQIAKTANIAANEYIVASVTRTKGDKRRRESVVNSTKNIGDKKRNERSNGASVRGLIRRLNGNSNSMGAAAMPTNAFPSATFKP